nr:hypothetical protein [Pseudomonas sp.]
MEYYGGSENLGVTHIRSDDWLKHRGSVGKPIVGAVHIVAEDDRNRELPADEIMVLCRQNLFSIKCPRSIDFVDSLPRTENGKLLKRVLRDWYVLPATAPSRV